MSLIKLVLPSECLVGPTMLFLWFCIAFVFLKHPELTLTETLITSLLCNEMLFLCPQEMRLCHLCLY